MRFPRKPNFDVRYLFQKLPEHGPWLPKALRLGRLSVYIEPRDAWVGVSVGDSAVYVCPLPFVVMRWSRG